MVFPSFNLFPHLTVLENLTLAPMWVGKIPKRQADERAMQRIVRVKIVEQNTPAEFFNHPKSERTKDFLSKILSH